MAEVPEAERRMREFGCRCGAKPGERCRSRNGAPRSYSHHGRYLSAVETGRLPIEDEADGEGDG